MNKNQTELLDHMLEEVSLMPSKQQWRSTRNLYPYEKVIIKLRKKKYTIADISKYLQSYNIKGSSAPTVAKYCKLRGI